MPKRILPLTEMQVQKAKPTDKEYKLSDGGGLFLLVTPSGGKLWNLKYRFNNKEKRLSLGAYPAISLSDARKRREDARKLLANGIDPSEVKKAQKAAFASSNENSFEVIARAWHAGKVEGWSKSHAKTTLERLEKNIFPWLGAKLVNEITLSDIKPVLHRIEERAPESARRMLVALNMIFRFCVASEYIDRSPLEGLKPSDIMKREPITRHYPAITDPKELAPFLRAVDAYRGTFIVKSAFKLSPLVFQRPGDLRFMEWAEIDFDAAEWNIPIERMKLDKKIKIKRKGEFHCVPLSRQALEILEEIKPLTGRSPYVFHNKNSYLREMSEAAITNAIRRIGYKGLMTGHGFRATARTILDEVLGFSPDVIDHQLAHAVRDALGRAYNRTSHLPQRRKMVQEWADYLDDLKSGAKVITIRKAE